MRRQGVPGRWGKRFCWATGCEARRGARWPVALPTASFPRHRQVVLEPVRRVGVAPAKHGTSSSIRQAVRAVLGAVGGPYQFWFVSRQLGALELEVRNAPEDAHQAQHQLAWARGEGASPRAHPTRGGCW